MIYPNFIKENNTIGVCAPSMGLSIPIKQNKLNCAIEHFNKYNIKVIETNHVRCNELGRSCDAKTRAKEFMELINNKNINGIIMATGGDFLIEVLPYLKFDEIASNPKWIQGYSDPTSILFTVTTKLDIATSYSHNMSGFGMNEWHYTIKNNLDILTGKNIIQNSLDRYEKNSLEEITGLESYNLDTEVKWKSFNDSVDIKGRLIGGCIDILTEILGTPYDYTLDFIERYKNDGIIWYFDNCELTCEDLTRTLWKFKECGWFKYTKAILFGRSLCETSYYDVSFSDTLKNSLSDLNIPIIYDMDFGHIPPRLTMINGAIAHITYQDNKGSIEYEYK